MRIFFLHYFTLQRSALHGLFKIKNGAGILGYTIDKTEGEITRYRLQCFGKQT